MNTEPGESSRFYFQNSNVFLTYSRCPLEPEVVGSNLKNLLSAYAVSFVAVNRELHQDGTPHIHALAQTNQRIYTSDTGFFDILGFHPNIQGTRNCKAVLAYISKYSLGEFRWGTFRARGARAPTARAEGAVQADAGSSNNSRPAADSEPGSGGSGPIRHRRAPRQPMKDEVMASILRRCSSRQEYLNEVKKCFPYDFCVRLQAWEYAAQKLYPDPPSAYEPPFPDSLFRCHETLSDWVRDNVYQVTPEVYQLLHPHADAEAELRWLHDTCFESRCDRAPSTSAAQQGQGRQHGPEA
nr:repA protein [Melinis repens associated virus]